MIWVYRLLIPLIWVVYLSYWWWRSRGVKTAIRVEPSFFGGVRAVMLWGAILLLSYPVPPAVMEKELWPGSTGTFWAGTLVTIVGLLFAVWARQYLAGNWSQSVTIKKDHELITSGPYRLARHPIYTGILTGFLGTVVVIGEVRAVVSLLLATLALWVKLRLEEKWMREVFGEKYEAYSRRTSALIPGLL